MSAENSLKNLGLSLPPTPISLSSYIPATRSGNILFTSGQIPLVNGELKHPGKVGKDVTLESAGESAILCCLNALAAISSLVPLEKVEKILKMGVYVACVPEFTNHHLVATFASDLLIQIFGEKGKHSRFAIGVSSLPLNACVELELMVEVQ
jgi:enamine deaminase RidA (YjgF/YER057c/UK114 family)